MNGDFDLPEADFDASLSDISFGQLRNMTAAMRHARDEAQMDLLAAQDQDRETRNQIAITFATLVEAVATFDEALEKRAELN